MKRSLLLMTIGLLLPISLTAQMRAMGGGGRSASSRPAPGFRSQARPVAPNRGVSRSFRSPVGNQHFGVAFRGRPFPGRRFHTRPFIGCFGSFNCINPFGFNGFVAGYAPYYPTFTSDLYSYPQPTAPDVVSQGSNDEALRDEVRRLSDEVADLRSDERNRVAANRPMNAGPLSAKEPVQVTLVFRDGHRVSTENYAIAGQTLWTFNEHTARKISIADLDAAATDQVNAANGVEFRLPAAVPPAR